MLLNRCAFVLPFVAFVSTSVLHAAQTGVLTCTGATPIKVSYFDISTPPSTIGSQTGGAGAGKASFGQLTIHAALQQFATLAPSVGSTFDSCTLTHNSLTFTFSTVLLSSVDAIAGASSTGVAGAASYTDATFAVLGVSLSGVDTVIDGGGDDGGWNRVTNTSTSSPTL